jgi:8-oxo-dGTP pyrophosphatase MutT (NUDIX family)
MLLLENLKPLKVYKRPLFLPTVDGDKKKHSVIYLLTPNYESSKNLMTSDMLINKLRFQSYYIEKDLTYFISSKVMNKVDDVTETYVRDFSEHDIYQSLCEMTAAERNKLKDSDFGLPSKRKYPLDSKAHVMSAIKFFNYVDKEDEAELARNLNRAINKYCKGQYPSVGKNNRFSKYYKHTNEAAVITESSYPSDVPKDIVDLLKYLNKEIEYGVVDKGKPITNLSGFDFWNNYKSLSINEFEKYKTGVCWDFVHYEANWFKKNGYKYETYYIEVNDKNGTLPTHTYLVFYLPNSTKVYYFESSWDEYAGIEEFNSLAELQRTVKKRCIEYAGKNSEVIPSAFVCNKFDASSTAFEHIGCGDYMKKASGGKTLLQEGVTAILTESISNEKYKITSERGFYNIDGTYNCIVTVTGVDKPLRGRGEMLILDKTGTRVYLCFDTDGSYKLPGGGFEPEESHLGATIRECREEARLEVIAAYDTGVRYVNMYKDNVDETQKDFAPENRFYGAYTEVFVGTAIDTYNGELDTVDVDEFMTTGEFYDIKEVYKKLRPEHQKALNSVVNESVSWVPLPSETGIKGYCMPALDPDDIPPLANSIKFSGYIDDTRLLRQILTPEMYADILSETKLGFDYIPEICLVASNHEKFVFEGTNKVIIHCITDMLKQYPDTYSTNVIEMVIAGLVSLRYPKLYHTIIPACVAEYFTGKETPRAEFFGNLVADKTLSGAYTICNESNLSDLLVLAKGYGINEFRTPEDFFTEAKEMTAASLTNSLKYRGSTKTKRYNGVIRNKAKNLMNDIKDKMQIDLPKPATTPAPAAKPEEGNGEDEETQVSESMLTALKEDAYIINGDYVTIFEDATYDPMLKRILYTERMVKRKEVTVLLDRVKADMPFIKYAYVDINRYAQKNLFVDLYYYQQAFFKNNTWKQKKGFGLYKEFLDRLINDKRIKAAGYTRTTVFISINDWYNNPSTRMWLYREDLNPISIIYELMTKDPEGLKKLFKGINVVFFGENKYFTMDFNDTKNAKRNAIKFKNFIIKINKGEEFGQEDLDSTEDTPTKEAIKADIYDKVEASKGVDLTPVDKKVKDEKAKKNANANYTSAKPSTRNPNELKKDTTEEEKPKEVVEAPPEEKKVDKMTANAAIARDDSAEKEEIMKQIADKIDQAADNAIDVDDALDYMDDDIDMKELLSGLDSMKDDAVVINAARTERMSQLDRELLDKSIKGRSIRDILDEDKAKEKAKLPESSLPVASPNEEWEHMSYMNFDKTYDLEKDLVNVFTHFSKVSRPLSVRNIKSENNSTSEDRVELYTVEYEDYRGKRYTIKLDIPVIQDNRFLLRGNLKTIQTQFFNMPIIKVDTDSCQIVTNYKKIIITRFNTASGRSIPNVSRFIKAASKYEGSRIKFVGGNNSRVCDKYVLPIDYIDLSGVFTTIETSDLIVYFNQDEIRKLYEVKEGMGVPYAYNKKTKEIWYYPNNNTTPFIDILFGAIITDPTNKDKEFFELYNSVKPSVSNSFSRAKIMGVEMPLVMVCAYSEGLTQVLKKSNVKYKFQEKLTAADRADLTKDRIRFSDGYLIYDVDYNSSLLMSGLKECDTMSHSFTEVDDKNMYLEFLEDYGGRIKADGLDNFYDCEIDPITKEVLEYYKLPTDYVSVLLYANYLMADNKFIRHTDTSSRRARRSELVAAYTYQVMSEVYGVYANSLKHNRTQAPFSCKQSAVIDKIMTDPTSSDYSVNSLLNDVETTNAITYKGLSGMNSDRSYSLDKRTYDESMLGVVGMSTGFSGNVGITRQATMDMALEGGRGYIKDSKGNTDKMNTASVLTATEAVMPFITTHDDPMRVAMSFVQTSKHAVRTEESDPLLVTSGADEALAYICSDQFAHKAKSKGVVKELTDTYMIIAYDDGTEEYVNLSETIEKNSDGGFYVPLKLDADPKLKAGSKIKPGQIVAYDKLSLSNSLGESDNLAYNVGKLAKIAIINTDEGFEDSGVITEEMAKKLSCRIIGKVECMLDKNTNIYNVVQVGQEIEQGDSLLVWQTPYDEEEVNALLKALANDREAVSELGRHTVKSEVTGRVAGMKIYRTVEDSELSDSLRKLVRKYERPIHELKAKLKQEGIDYSTLPADYPLDATGKMKNSYDSVLIEFYVEYNDIVGVGDKITYNAANKAIISKVIPEGKEPYTDFRPNEHISAFVSVTSIQKRMVQSTVTYGAIQKLMVELDRTCKDIAGIPYDDSQV